MAKNDPLLFLMWAGHNPRPPTRPHGEVSQAGGGRTRWASSVHLSASRFRNSEQSTRNVPTFIICEGVQGEGIPQTQRGWGVGVKALPPPASKRLCRPQTFGMRRSTSSRFSWCFTASASIAFTVTFAASNSFRYASTS